MNVLLKVQRASDVAKIAHSVMAYDRATEGLVVELPIPLLLDTLVTQVTPHPRYARTEKPRISERELVVPTLRLLDDGNRGWMATSDIISRLTELFTPSGQDAAMLDGRSDTYFSLTVRNMISHRDQPSSFIHSGLAHYERHGLRISDEGRSTIRALLS